MQKRKRDPVTIEMRQRLMANRDGRLTAGQWLDMIVQPLIILIALLGLSFLIFGDDMIDLFDDAGWLILPLIALLILVPFLLRAYRYARAPLKFTRLYAGVQPWWGFWRPMIFYGAGDEAVKFGKRLAPRPLMRIEEECIIYYLEEPKGKVLLSVAPADHEEVDSWLPTKNFQARQQRRVKRT